MRRLVWVEIRRLCARRLVRVLLAALLAGLLTGIVIVAVHSNRDLAAARAAAAREAQQATPPPGMPGCPGGGGAGPPPPGVSCRPTAAEFYVDPRFHFAEGAPGLLIGAVVASALVAAVAGASVIGAEWAAGTFAGLLVWEPRRLRVVAAKLTALVVGFAVVGLAAITIMVCGGWLVAATRGTLAGTDPHLVRELVLRGARGMAIVASIAVLTGALASLLRSTAGALGVLGGYLILGENAVRGLHPQWTRWLLGPNLGALLVGHLDIPPPLTGPVARLSRPFVLSGARSATYLLSIVVIVVAAAAVTVRRRDTT